MKTLITAAALCAVSGAFAGEWQAYGGNPVLGNAKLGTCFDVNVRTDGPDGTPYTMYFSWRSKGSIALVRSQDGFNWTQEPEVCLEADRSMEWEKSGLNRSSTVKKDGVWHMWYTGQQFVKGNWREGWSRIGYATSTDGVHFTRVQKEPVMVPELPFEKTSVMNPFVCWDEKRSVWRMWYAAGEIYEPNELAYAESKDGIHWKKNPRPMFSGAGGLAWDRDRVGACEVYPYDGRWIMFYIGYSDIDTARIGFAVSDDGVTNWKRYDRNPIVAPDLCTWNSSACYKPSCIRDEKHNRWMVYYNGRNGGPEYVGMAVHEGLDLFSPSSAPKDLKAKVAEYVGRFNSKDEELYTNAIPNSAAAAFLADNVPLFACPDKDVERTYYFRWWTFRKHLRHDSGFWTVTEFLPNVGWAGFDNTIVCPAGHHFREGRWLRNPEYLTDLSRYWLAKKESANRWDYSSWLYTGVNLFSEVHGLDGRGGLAEELLDAAVAYYRRWEQGFERKVWARDYKTFRQGGDGKGGFTSVDDREGTELSLGGDGYKPLLASAMWSEAVKIAEVAERCGRAELAAEFRRKAETNRQSIFANCWNDRLGFFTTGSTNGVKGTVRELHGYAPWYFGMPVDGRKADFALLFDEQGFSGRYGLTFPERRASGFAISYKGHECQWNGPSWPFATSIALTAYANYLHSTSPSTSPSPSTSTSSLHLLLWQYADAHRRTKSRTEDWTVVPWIDENQNPDTGDWISRTLLQERKQAPRERGKDYNHSTFCDLVISGLVGFIPNGAKGFTVDPLWPESWDYCVLENLRYRGHDVSIRWSRGEQSYRITVDGSDVLSAAEPVKFSVSVGSAP